MKLRFMFSCLLVGSVATSYASFELVMVADRGTKSVHRFDGTTGAYLGAFGGGYLQNPVSMTLDRAGNRVFVADALSGDGSAPTNVRVWEFDYNTGEYKNNFTARNAGGDFVYQNPQISYFSGSVAVGFDTRFADTFNTSTGVFAGTATFQTASNPHGLAYDSIGQLWAPEGGTYIQRYLSGGVTRFTLSSTFAASSVVRQTAISGDRLIGVGALSWSRLSLSALNSSTTNPLTTYTESSGVSSTSGCGFGHGDIVYTTGSGTLAGGTGFVNRYLYSSGTRLQSFGGGVLSEPRAMAVVVAPEPGSLAALALGGAALLRRRRRRD